MSIQKTEAEWKKELTPEQYRILREKGTEPAGSGKYYHNKEKGLYLCAACGAKLFSSDTKYDSGSGWPSFYRPAEERNIKTDIDDSMGMRRVEIMCQNCGSHLGHLFDDAYGQPTGQRYCINSCALRFKSKE